MLKVLDLLFGHFCFSNNEVNVPLKIRGLRFLATEASSGGANAASFQKHPIQKIIATTEFIFSKFSQKKIKQFLVNESMSRRIFCDVGLIVLLPHGFYVDFSERLNFLNIMKN